MESQTFTLGPNVGTSINPQLAFLARSVQVDNNTPYTVVLGQTLEQIPPFTLGAVHKVDGSQSPTASLVLPSPGKYPAPPVTNNQVATLTYSQADQATTMGVLTSQPILSQLLFIQTIAADGVAHNINVTIPAGTQGLVLFFAGGNVNTNFTSALKVSGLQSGIGYFNITNASSFTGIGVNANVLDPQDTTLNLQWNIQVATPPLGPLILCGLPSTVLAIPATGSGFTPADAAGVPIDTTGFTGNSTAINALYVQEAQTSLSLHVSPLNAGASVTILPALTGNNYYRLWSLTMQWSSNTGGDHEFQNSNGTALARIANNITPVPPVIDFKGAYVDSGFFFIQGLVLQNVSPTNSSAFLLGSLSYG